MKTATHASRTASPERPGEAVRGVVQRCACGGAKGPSGECAECRRKRLARKRVQTRLRVGAPDDAYEREADRIAESVVRAPAAAPPRAAPVQVQRVGATAEAAGAEAPASVDAVLASPGRPLDGPARRVMEARLGYDFSAVRVHTDARAAASADDVHAEAYTVGRDVVFARGAYAPGSRRGQALLAHELVHTVQQSGGVLQRYGARRLQRQAVGEEEHGAPATGGESASEQGILNLPFCGKKYVECRLSCREPGARSDCPECCKTAFEVCYDTGNWITRVRGCNGKGAP